MKLDKLWIEDFKNLKGIEIDFDQDVRMGLLFRTMLCP